MKVTRIFVAGLAIATMGFSANASAQESGPPRRPRTGLGRAAPSPPPPPPAPPPHWGGYDRGYGYQGYGDRDYGGGGYGWRGAGYGYRPHYRPYRRCWTEYRGWERVRICR
jgi:hypothetical protein